MTKVRVTELDFGVLFMLYRLFAATFAVVFVLLANPALAHSGDGYGGRFYPSHTWLGSLCSHGGCGSLGRVPGVTCDMDFAGRIPLGHGRGAATGIAGLPLPAVETGIALSAVVLGLMIVLAARPPLWIAAVIVGAFAIFQGYTHGTELPSSISAFAYAVGFVISTGLLHMIGIAFGLLVKWPAGSVAVRGAGSLISLAALWPKFFARSALYGDTWGAPDWTNFHH